MRLLDYHAWINGKALRWADDVIDFDVVGSFDAPT
jgi:hypothetical protein